MFKFFGAFLLGVLPYNDAYKLADVEQEPLVIYVGAEWCGPCKRMRPRVERVFSGHVYLDADEDSGILRKILGDRVGSVPQLVVYRKKNGTWLKTAHLVGEQGESSIEGAVNAGSK